MKIKLLKNMGIDGKHTKAGTEVDAEPGFAKHQVSVGRAELVEPAEPKGKRGVMTTENGTEPLGDDDEPAKPKRGK